MDPQQTADTFVSDTHTAQSLERVDLPRPNTSALYGNLLRLSEQSENRDAFLLELIKYTLASTCSLAGIYFQRVADQGLETGPRIFARDVADNASRLLQDLKPVVQEVETKGIALTAVSTVNPAYSYSLTPVSNSEGQNEVFAVVLPASQQQGEFTRIFIQLIAGFINLQQATTINRASTWEAEQSARLIELVAETSEIRDSRAAWQSLASSIQKLLGCTRVAIVTTSANGLIKRIQAVSGLSDFDKRSALARDIERALSDTLSDNDFIIWPADSRPGRVKPAGHEALLRSSASSLLMSIPLKRYSGTPAGGLVCWWKNATGKTDATARLLQASAIPIGGLIDSLDRKRTGSWLTNSKASSTALQSLKPYLAATAALALAASLFIPVTHKIQVGVTLEPTISRVAAAPFDGLLSESSARPGKMVARDELLARLDGREIELKLSGIEAEIRVAAKRRDISMAESDTHATQIARLDMERLELRRSLLVDQLANLEIRSPIDGIVVSGDLDRKHGSPLNRGQILFEVAPLEHMLARVAIPAENISYAQPGLPLQLELEGLPGRQWELELGDIRPRAEIVQGENVFVSEVNLDNQAMLMRPGMEGQGDVAAGMRSLGWVLFHKPWEHISRWLGAGNAGFQGDSGH